jgi:hypothetical protein
LFEHPIFAAPIIIERLDGRRVRRAELGVEPGEVPGLEIGPVIKAYEQRRAQP